MFVLYKSEQCSKLPCGVYMITYGTPEGEISFPIFIRKEVETRKLERKSKQQISRLNDLLYRLNDIISC